MTSPTKLQSNPDPASGARGGTLAFRPLRTIDHVLVAVDFSAASEASIIYALHFARHLRARLTLLHIVPAAPLPMHLGLYDFPSPEALELAERRIAELAHRYLRYAGGLPIATAVRIGAPKERLCREVWDLEADLIILNSHRHSSFREMVLGSFATEMIRHAPCPLLILRDDESLSGAIHQAACKPPSHFLVPVDFSPRCESAVRAACLLAAKCHGRISLLHTVDRKTVDEDLDTIGADFGAYSADANSRLRAVAARLVPEPLRGEAIIRQGTPYAQIVSAAHGTGSDLLVLTTHGRTGLAHLLMGSTAEQVMKHAPCPVLIIREG